MSTRNVLAFKPKTSSSANGMIAITSHSEWVKLFLDFIRPYQKRVTQHPLFEDFRNGRLTIQQSQAALVNFYPLISTFPQFMGLSLAKVPQEESCRSRKARDWLVSNISQERLHALWWRDFAIGFGVDATVFDHQIVPPPRVDALNHFLWHVCTHGTLSEAVGSSNFAIEGATGEWTKSIQGGFEKYRNVPGVKISKRTVKWVSAHADYDDRHPLEALEIIKSFVATEEEQDRVRHATARTLEFYELALNACYESTTSKLVRSRLE